MNRLKKVLAIALSAALMVPSTAFAAYKDSVGNLIMTRYLFLQSIQEKIRL